MKFNSTPTVGGSKNFLKLKDGESVSGIFSGDVHEFFVLWGGGKSEVVAEGTPKASFRFRINFIVNENGAYVSKIWEQGSVIYNALKELHEEYDLQQTVVKITRKGSDKNTTYTVMPQKKQPTPEVMKQIVAVELQDLETKQSESSPADNASFDPDEVIPF